MCGKSSYCPYGQNNAAWTINETWTISDDFDEGEDGGEPPYLLYSF